MFLLFVDDGNFCERLKQMNCMWERSGGLKLVLVYLWFQVVPLPFNYILSASKFDEYSHNDDYHTSKSAFYVTCGGHFIQNVC